MDAIVCIKFLLLLYLNFVNSIKLPETEDDLLTLDAKFSEYTDEQFSALGPEVVNLNYGLVSDKSPGGSYESSEGLFDAATDQSIRNRKSRRHRKKAKASRFENELAAFGDHKTSKVKSKKSSKSNKEAVVETQMTPVDVRSISWKKESLKRVERCERGGWRGITNTKWNETNCISCLCKGAQVECERPECPTLKCKNPTVVEGECCPKCPEKLCENGDGRKFKHGAEWHKDDCTFCECDKGKVLCSVEDCQVPACKNPIKVPGKCCPTCLDSSCRASNGSKIPPGEVWKEGLCTHCYCAGGERKCAEEKCPFVNCTGRYRPEGKCCERCTFGVVDCLESAWGSWSDCPVQECGGGMRRRFRSVLIPLRNGGDFCPHMSEAEMCPRLPCDVLPVCPVTEWTSWGHCTATCGSGRRMRSRTKAPITGAAMTSLIDCSKTHFQETTHCYVGACMNHEIMMDHLAEAPIHDDICFEVTWSDWGRCSADCGDGVQRRHEVLIDVSHPRGHLCHLLDETRKCQGQNCITSEKADTRCRVSAWSDWTPCTKTCGPGGRKTKYRTVIQKPAKTGRPCPKLYISKNCKNKPCQAKNLFFGIGCMTDSGQFYRNGEHWMKGPCVSCQCTDDQEQCHKVPCN